MSFIGVVDSGVGGLTVLQKIQCSYPNASFCYIADHAYCPYGTKPRDVLFNRVNKLVSYLKSAGARAIVIACNTLSVYASELRQIYNLPVYEVISPTCNSALNNGGSVKRVALLATQSTLFSGMYHGILKERGVEVIDFDCSNFVPFVERCAVTSSNCLSAVDSVLRNLPRCNVDKIILGCTHFPLLRGLISRYCDDGDIVECSCVLPNGLFSVEEDANVAFLTTGDVNTANCAAAWYGNAIFSHTDI